MQIVNNANYYFPDIEIPPYETIKTFTTVKCELFTSEDKLVDTIQITLHEYQKNSKKYSNYKVTMVEDEKSHKDYIQKRTELINKRNNLRKKRFEELLNDYSKKYKISDKIVLAIYKSIISTVDEIREDNDVYNFDEVKVFKILVYTLNGLND